MFNVEGYYYLREILRIRSNPQTNQPMFIKKNIMLYLAFIGLSLSSCSQAPSNQTKVQFVPASNQNAPSVITYSTNSGDMILHYLSEGTWSKYDVFPSPKLSIKGPLNLEYIPGEPGAFPSLFASNDKGDFEFFYLQENQWISNDLLPQGKVKMNSKKVTVEFTPAIGPRTAFVNAYSADGKEFCFYEMVDGKWVKNTNVDQTLD